MGIKEERTAQQLRRLLIDMNDGVYPCATLEEVRTRTTNILIGYFETASRTIYQPLSKIVEISNRPYAVNR